MTIIEAIRDRNLFGALPCFRDLTTWRSWFVFLSALYGLPLDAAGVELFRKHTGRTEYAPPPGGWREAVCVTGRQSGKTRVASVVAGYEAAVTDRDGDGSELTALMVAQDHRSSLRTIFRYAAAPFEASPLLSGTVAARTADTLTLRSGVTLAAYPCRPASVRGLRARVVVAEELAFYLSGEGLAVDQEMLRALRPCLATTGGRLLILSSPYGQTGALWDLHRRHYGRDDSPVLVWQASAPEMNPTLPRDYLARMAEDDPEAYRSEVLGEFRAGISSLFEAGALERVVVPGRHELPRVAETRYYGFVDPSGGRSDAFTVAIGHTSARTAIVDVVRAWRAPFNPSGVVAEAAALLKSYGVAGVVGDKYAGEWPREAFRSQAVNYALAERARSDLYLELLAFVNGGQVELPDVPELSRELRGLERRRGSSGRDRVDHRPGGHDDLANAVAGLVVEQLHPGRSRGASVAYGLVRPSAALDPADQRVTTGRRAECERDALEDAGIVGTEYEHDNIGSSQFNN